jgi:hypothetical protein
MLFDPFEEQFNLPTLFVNLCDGERGEGEVVGQELQPLAGLRVTVADSAQFVRIRGCRLSLAHDMSGGVSR